MGPGRWLRVPYGLRILGKSRHALGQSWADFRESGATDLAVLVSEVPDCSFLFKSPAVFWFDVAGCFLV